MSNRIKIGGNKPAKPHKVSVNPLYLFSQEQIRQSQMRRIMSAVQVPAKEVEKEEYELYKPTIDQANHWLSKAYIVLSLGNEFFEEGQSILKSSGLDFCFRLKNAIRNINENFDTIVKEMNSMMSPKDHSDFTHDYYMVHDSLIEFLDNQLRKSGFSKTE